MSNVIQILNAIEQGDPHATSQLLPLVCEELRKLAAQKLACEAPGQTLQATIDGKDEGGRMKDETDASKRSDSSFILHPSSFQACDELVKLRYFLGCTMAEAAQILGGAPATAEEDWTYAKAWLRRQWLRDEEINLPG